MNIVNFPGLGIHLKLNPVAFTMAGKDIYWYGIIIAVGLLLAIFFCAYEGKRVNLPDDAMIDIALYCIPVAIIFARLYYVIFKFSDYKDNPISIFYIWQGGLAVYGGIIGGILTAYIYCKVTKIPFLKILDVGSFGLLIGQAIGRWGNFVNAEAYGSQTNVWWRMQVRDIFTNMMVNVHPTFLYESIWNIIGFIGLFLYRKHKKFSGEIFLLYITWYGLGRFWIEGLRADSLMLFGNIRVSQLLAFLCIIIGCIILIKKYREVKAA